MADIYIDWCPKCGGRAEIEIKGNVSIICRKCGHSVIICDEKELNADGMGRKNVLPAGKAMDAIRKWNTKEEVNGR